MSNLTEEQIRQIVRDEREQIKKEEQKSCPHLKSATLNEDGKPCCDKCGGEVIWVPGMGTGGFEDSPIDTRRITSVTEVAPKSKEKK